MSVEAYKKEEIDRLIETNLQPVDDDGVVFIDGIACITVEKYAVNVLKIDGHQLQRKIRKKQMKPFARATSGTRSVDVYKKDDIDALFD